MELGEERLVHQGAWSEAATPAVPALKRAPAIVEMHVANAAIDALRAAVLQPPSGLEYAPASFKVIVNMCEKLLRKQGRDT